MNDRLTARTKNGVAYLVNVKPNEQEVESPHRNTLKCILDCFDRLAAYEDTGLTPRQIQILQDTCSKDADERVRLRNLVASLQAELARVMAERDAVVEKAIRWGESLLEEESTGTHQ